MAGEWTFTWINDGQAIQDVLSVPYQWAEPSGDIPRIQMTTVRTYNPKRQAWEGFHVLNGAMIYFWVVKTPRNQIIERYQREGEPLIVWLYADLQPDSFKVTISQSTDNGNSWALLGELWCKRRSTVVP